MMWNWPQGYRERIEAIIGAKFDGLGRVQFLNFDFKTIGEAKAAIGQIRLVQKQLRQVKTELGNKIKEIKSRRLPRPRKGSSTFAALGFASLNINDDLQINHSKNVILTINKLLDTCEGRKIEIETWIARQKPSTDESFVRRPIPEDVQIFVWNRDGRRCVKCGSQENLEFDHIIPISKGGSNTARNIQLLCASCNRGKSNTIGG